MQIICFHNPNEENGYLSNWYMSPFTALFLDGAVYDVPQSGCLRRP